MLLGGQALVAEENDQMVQKCLMNLTECGVIQRLGQINAVDFCPERTGERNDFNFVVDHRFAPVLCARILGPAASALQGFFVLR